ncbi:MAG: DUF4230 domain-containing protein [Ruminococcus sp.]|uniref:DUF4230 domain-containing protein n=1 Tax=Ruminococcus sp. TaxID=41978 RepID=UPI0025E69618|nr:DUF4230 domain-containing protein [Ruminococcus sp.]MCR5601768.1 DUF4230 domain-containing protein [Ruminococcus sp.]
MNETNNSKFQPQALIKNKLVLSIVVSVLVLIFGIGIGAKAFSKPKKLTAPIKKEATVSSITLEEILLPASDLISMKYTYTDVDIYENSKKAFGVKIPLTTDKVIFTYSGIVSAGIDLSQLTYDINNTEKKITITLPEPQFMSHEMDESGFKFYDAKNSIFTETKLEDYTTLMSRLKEAKEEKLRNDGEFFPSVTENAKNVLNDLFKISELTSEYEIIYN